jgi:ABC-type glycerol-3-phosphate transport system substrate-binding protein
VGLGKTFSWLDNPQAQEAWKWYEELSITNHAAPRRGESVPNVNMFSAGLIATAKDGIYHIPGLPQEVGDKFRYGLTLMKGPARKGSGAFSNAFCVSNQTDIPEEALKLAVYLTSTDVGVYSVVHAIGRGLQARRSQWTHPDVLALHPIYGTIAEYMDEDLNPFPHPWNLRYQEVFDTYSAAIEPLRYGEKTWDEQAPVIQAKVQGIMDQPRP